MYYLAKCRLGGFSMRKLIAGIHRFQKQYRDVHWELYKRLAEHGQFPEALFITCCDSRVDPLTITHGQAGDLFIHRNIGNFVPPYSGDPLDDTGVAATVEYAVEHLEVRDIIVCGHSDCGAMKSLYKDRSKFSGTPHIARWLSHGDRTLPVVYLFVSIGLVEIMRGLERLIESHTLRTVPLILLAVAVTVFSWNAYFDVWGQARDVRVAYHTTLFEVARELDGALDLPADAAISSIYPNRFHDPYAMQLTLKRKDMPLRWFTGSFMDMNDTPHASLIFPQPPGDGTSCEVVSPQQIDCASGITTTAPSAFTSTVPNAAQV